VHVAHDCVVGNNCILANGVTLAGHVIVEDYVNIGGLVAVQQFVRIGAHSMTAGGSLVRKDVPPFVKCAREPLSYVGINSIGLRRRGFSSEKIAHLQEIYRIIYLEKWNVTQALDIIEAKIPATIERDAILSFISKSSVGILKGYTAKA
ncbi:MAG: acyl-[acyl-carrier-protein]--UDP-N-acetylglucosamine O-acyltransferase, partial [Bacteroidales bacterium]